MERGRRRGTIRIHALTLALVALELVAQAFSLSWFPTSGSVGGLYLAARRCVRRGGHVAAGSASNLFRKLPGLGDPSVTDLGLPEGPGKKDDRAEQADWLRVEVIAPHRANLPVSVLPPALPAGLSTVRRPSPSAIVPSRGIILVRSIPLSLCKLTC